MFLVSPILRKDFYKVGHPHQMKPGTKKLYSNFTPRGTRRDPAPKGIIWFGLQAYLIDTLIEEWSRCFFEVHRDTVLREYKRILDHCLGPNIDVNHVGELHELGYLPLRIKSVPEGTLVPYRVPACTITNTDEHFAWLVNSIESDFSSHMWLPPTSATTAFGYRQQFERYAKLTGADRSFIQWQGHDFSYRGMCGLWAAAASGAAHLLSFTGTDTIPAISFIEEFYSGNVEKQLIGGSVPATEHMVMCLAGQDGEFDLIKRLTTEVYPKDVVSIVCDTWSLKKVVTDYLVQLKDIILAREGKVVVRPDSGVPEKIVNGDPDSSDRFYRMGLTRALYEIFGGTINHAGFIELNPHIGWIYGDSISPERQTTILDRLYKTGFASSTPVLGIGSYTYQHVTRDTDGWAFKATYAEDADGANPLSKDPETDNGVKKSARGLLKIDQAYNGSLTLAENCSWAEEATGVLQTVFKDSELTWPQTFEDIRARVKANLDD